VYSTVAFHVTARSVACVQQIHGECIQRSISSFRNKGTYIIAMMRLLQWILFIPRKICNGYFPIDYGYQQNTYTYTRCIMAPSQSVYLTTYKCQVVAIHIIIMTESSRVRVMMLLWLAAAAEVVGSSPSSGSTSLSITSASKNN
jgi:hypothetical protein